MTNEHVTSSLTPADIAVALGKKNPPSDEQAAVISAGMGPMLVTAGAGAGKTETMANRVVYLVANGWVKSEEVLGLTFTRKAAGELEQRIRKNLIGIRDSKSIRLPEDIRDSLAVVAPKAMTYDAFVGELVQEFGLLAPMEPFARMITEAERYALAHDVVSNFSDTLTVDKQVASVTEDILHLASNMSNQLADGEDVRQSSEEFIRAAEELPPSNSKTEFSVELQKKMDAQRARQQYVALVEKLQEVYRDERVTTFGEHMAVAARLVQNHPGIRAEICKRYKVVMLDEYQDTSHAQRVFLRELFGMQSEDAPVDEEETADFQPTAVTAVGDPMQSIYGWRGASEENLRYFTQDFPASAKGDTPAPKKELTTAWRNPRLVLAMANEVADVVFAGGAEAYEKAKKGEISDGQALGARESERLVGPLQPRIDAPEGEVKLGYFRTAEEECDFVARHMRDKYRAAIEADKPLSAAILVRKNKHSVEMAQHLESYDVPYEIVGLGGLLSQPEVQDELAIATMLIRPQDTAAALRVLSGPMCGIGLRDIEALHERAKNLAGRGSDATKEEADEEKATLDDGTVLGWLRQKAEDCVPEQVEQAVGLTDAVADLGERERYTPAGLERLEALSAKLRALRTYSLSKPLIDLFADIERAFNLRTEALARGGKAGTAHLDKFAELVSGFAGTGLAAWLDYCEMAREREEGLEPGDVPAASDRVLIMTTHKAKGLEWEHVSVLHADSQTYAGKASSYVTNAAELPRDDDYIDAEAHATKKGPNRTSFDKGCKDKKEESRHRNELEAARLFYVAMTRTESSLTITGGGTNNDRGKKKQGPYFYLERLADKFPDSVVQWEVPEEPEDTAATAPIGSFPYLKPDPVTAAAAYKVRAAMDEVPPATAGERYEQWETEASALIEEHRGLMAPEVEVAMPTELTASDVVAVRRDPTQFARRQRRPVPFKPNAYAKRGTAFHTWIEDFYGGSALLSEDELPGQDEEVTAEDLENLKDNFLRSQWAQRIPVEVEAPFEITVGSAVIRGRMDAVFRDPDGTWLVVDWKTGRPPRGEEMHAAEQQLAVYREAWRRIRERAGEKNVRVEAMFHYISDNHTLHPRHLGGAEELQAILRAATRDGVEPGY